MEETNACHSTKKKSSTHQSGLELDCCFYLVRIRIMSISSFKEDVTNAWFLLKWSLPSSVLKSGQEIPSPEEADVYRNVQACLELQQSYVFREAITPWEKEVISDPSTPKPNPSPFDYTPEGKSNRYFKMEDGVVHVYANEDSKEKLFLVADAITFFIDLHHILKVIAARNIRTICHHRLVLLEQKFSRQLMLNADREFLAQKSAPYCDFYNVRKVDIHVHHLACMNQKHPLRFIKSKLRKEPDEVVIFRDGRYLTLNEVFESLDLTGNNNTSVGSSSRNSFNFVTSSSSGIYLLDRSGLLYGELARFVLRLLGIRTKPKKVRPLLMMVYETDLCH